MARHFLYDERWNGAVIDAEHWHFHRQLLNRYGIVMGPGDFSHLLKSLREKRALLVKKVGRGRAIYRCRIKSTREWIFILAAKRQAFTAYPPNRSLKLMTERLLEYRREQLLDRPRDASPHPSPDAAGEQ